MLTAALSPVQCPDIFGMGPGTRIRVLVLAMQAFYLLSHLPRRQNVFFFLFFFSPSSEPFLRKDFEGLWLVLFLEYWDFGIF